MAECSGKCKALCLPAGKPDAAISHYGVHALLHFLHFLVKAYRFQERTRILVFSKKDIVSYRIIKQLRIMPKISNAAAALCIRQFLQLSAAKSNASFIGIFAQKGLAKGGLSTGYRPGNTYDLSRLCLQAHIPVNRTSAGISKADMGKYQFSGCFLFCLRKWCYLHQWFDPPPGHLRLMHGIEQLRRTGGFH